MPDHPDTVATFPDIDQAESALDWIGLDITEGDGWFEGELDEDAAVLIEEVLAADDTPRAVRDLATALLTRWRDETAPRTWRVGFPA